MTILVVVLFASTVGWWTGVDHRSVATPWTVIEVVDGDTIVVARYSDSR